MHPDIEQLLSLRDGEPVTAEAFNHLATCDVCAREVSRLRQMQSSLRELPRLRAPQFEASKLKAVPTNTPRRKSYAVVGLLAAGIAAIAITLSVNLSADHVVPTAADSSSTASLEIPTSIQAEETISQGTHDFENGSTKVIALANQSRRLEHLLEQLPERPRVERAGTAATIDTLQTGIQWVDYQLSMANEVGLNEQQSAQLWQNRVTLMDSLLKVRFTQTQQFAALL